MRRLLFLVAAVVLLAACGSVSQTRTVTQSVTRTHTVPAGPTGSTGPSGPTGPSSAVRVSTCSYLSPGSSACEQVPPAGSCHFRVDATTGAKLPDPSCTPGATNPAVTPATAKTTICKSGYTGTIRPPTSYTGPLKRKLMAAYGMGSASLAGYELDHLVPLEGGGAAADPANLWPEAYAPAPGARQKDDEENFLRSELCGSRAALMGSLQASLASDWAVLWRVDRPSHIAFGAVEP